MTKKGTVLGIDTGGTYTDGVLMDYRSGRVLASSKSLTTYDDLSKGIGAVINAVASPEASSINLVSVSTTLATNSVVEGKGGRVGLLLLGYNKEMVENYRLHEGFATELFYYIHGGHNINGEEVAPLDTAAVSSIAHNLKGKVDAFAISGYFGVYNPEHERAAREIVREICDCPVVCGHELSSKLNSVKRAATAVLNARLVPVIHQLILSIKKAMAAHGIVAPLYVVKGDGSLVHSDIATERPIETILSGPAASAVGAKYLSKLEDCIVVDIGGTTTDIALLRNGQLSLNANGAEVEGWQTSVMAVEMKTMGLGGDSQISVDKDKGLLIGPQRVVPLCLASGLYPTVLSELRKIKTSTSGEANLFHLEFLRLHHGKETGIDLDDQETEILRLLGAGPLSISLLAKRLGKAHPLLLNTRKLESLRIVERIGLTLTDMLHAEGSYIAWNCEAAQLAFEIFCRSQDAEPEAMIQRIKRRASEMLLLALLDKVISEEDDHNRFPGCPSCEHLVRLLLAPEQNGALRFSVQLTDAIVAVGAPAEAYIPPVAALLNTRVVIPEHAEVANAIGSAVGNVIFEVDVTVNSHMLDKDKEGFVVHLPTGISTFGDKEQAKHFALARSKELAREGAMAAGAQDITVRVKRDEFAEGPYYEARLRAVAVGKPRIF